MSHKTRINGTSYDINGGKTRVNGSSYSITGGKTRVSGTVYPISFGSSWPDDINHALEFVSASLFSISCSKPGWNGTIEYCNGGSWEIWNGESIDSGKSVNGQCIYFRGTGNTNVATAGESGFPDYYSWISTDCDLECNGNIGYLLDYQAIISGDEPEMDENCFCAFFYNMRNSLISAPSLPFENLSVSCYAEMFSGCAKLTTPPSLPSTTLADNCYASMFFDCVSLNTLPTLPARTLPSTCYHSMFDGCSKIMLSKTKTGNYTRAYKISAINAEKDGINNMFKNTGGTFTGTPTLNTTYYTPNNIV